MKAIRVHEFAEPAVLRIDEVPAPLTGENQVLVRVLAAGVNPIDWKIADGFFPRKLPITLGQDFAGVIESVPAGSRWLPGDAVFGMLPTEATGSYSEMLAADAGWIARKPQSLSFEQAAGVATGALTAWYGLFDIARLTPGKWILVHGGAGAVGAMTVQLAKTQGAWVAATASGIGLERLQQYGVDLAIDYRTQRFEDVVGAAGGVDLVFDTLSGETRARSWQVVRDGGAIVSTLGTTSPPDEAISRGITGLPGFGTIPDGSKLTKIASMFDRGELVPLPIETMSLERADEALDVSRRGHAKNKLVLTTGN